MKNLSTEKNDTNDVQLTEFITKHFASSGTKFKPGNKLYAKHIIGLDTWKVLDKGFKTILGAAIFEMVSKHQLPLTYDGKTGSNWHTYILK